MRPTHQFTVTAEIPEELAAVRRLAFNLHWAWDREIAAVFDRIDQQQGDLSWRRTGRHPVELVASTPPERWRKLAEDDAFRERLRAASGRLDHSLGRTSWFDARRTDAGSPLASVAYFSPEFGITEALPQYSGGLGVLAGDHLKASSDLGLPLIGVGLFYQEGYFHQELDSRGVQSERNVRLDPVACGLVDTGVIVTVDLAGVDAAIRVWRADVGRIALYLLDTNVAPNPPEVVAVTDRLYGGDVEHRVRQEIVLGIGGVRALRALGIAPQVFHMNEGHAGFLGLERVREWVDRGLSFDAAIEAVRAGGVFTTHTPVPAGIDRFPRDLFERYFGRFAELLGVTFDELYGLGLRDDEPQDAFNMAVMGLRLASWRNGVAALHGQVARQMFSGMWPALDAHETPIGHVTNGVHARSWVSDRVDALMSNHLGDQWHQASRQEFARVHELDHGAIWSVRRDGRRELVELVRDRLGGDLLDPEVLTIGFARRFATYKRANLLLEQRERLERLILDADRPVQFVFAGKAHPADQPGKAVMKQIVKLTNDPELRRRVVFIPDYDIGIARTMYHGCDVWLNTPRRPMEACGTSGMKAALNGVLNCSIRDGWWDEMSDGTNGWDIRSFLGLEIDQRDQREASATFEVFERELVPLFYARGGDGLPHGWIERIKNNWATLGWNVTAARMVREYTTELYEPAAAAADRASAADGAVAAELAAWRLGVSSVWDSVQLALADDSEVGDGLAGEPRRIVATVDPGKLRHDEIVVSAVHGALDADGELDPAEVDTVLLRHESGNRYVGEITPRVAGSWGLCIRAMPTHPGLSIVRETGLVVTA